MTSTTPYSDNCFASISTEKPTQPPRDHQDSTHAYRPESQELKELLNQKQRIADLKTSRNFALRTSTALSLHSQEAGAQTVILPSNTLPIKQGPSNTLPKGSFSPKGSSLSTKSCNTLPTILYMDLMDLIADEISGRQDLSCGYRLPLLILQSVILQKNPRNAASLTVLLITTLSERVSSEWLSTSNGASGDRK